MGKVLFLLLLALVVGLGVYTSLCRPCFETPPQITAREFTTPSSANSHIQDSEATFKDLRQGTEKGIIWHGNENEQTEYAIVYVHGFTASKEELRPVPDILAKALKANLFYTRLTGHGRPAEALGEATANQWLNDVVEAANVGRAIGRKVILVGASTGGSLITWLAADPKLSKDVAAVILVSPNYGLHSFAAHALRLPFAEKVVPILFGPTRGFTPANDEHAYWWTPDYPTKALVPMAQTIDLAVAAPIEDLKIPAYFVFSKNDQVVDGNATAKMIDRWGGPHEQLIVDTHDNKKNHVPAGQVLSPSTTDMVTSNMTKWLTKTLNLQPGTP